MSIKPLHDRISVKRFEARERTVGGKQHSRRRKGKASAVRDHGGGGRRAHGNGGRISPISGTSPWRVQTKGFTEEWDLTHWS